MEGHSTDALFARGRSQERNRSNFSSGISKSKGRSKSLGGYVGGVEKKGTTRSSVDPKLRKRRDLKNLLLQKKRTPRKKEGMSNWLL